MRTLGSAIAPFLRLLKFNLVLMNLLTALLGFVLASRFHGLAFAWDRAGWMLAGCLLAGCGAMALNQVLERDVDARMERTKSRPMPLRQIAPLTGLLYGTGLILGGVFLLYFLVNLLAAFLMLLIAFVYVLVYTPLKQISWLNTPVGAVSGAVPPLVGWAAAAGTLQAEAWLLFLILFFWQHPHFYALAWLYREDYRRGGLRMLPVIDGDGRRTIRQVLFFTALLLPLSLLPSGVGLTGWFYLVATAVLGVAFLGYAIALARHKDDFHARRLFRASLAYLPLLLLFVGIDLIWRT